MRLGVKFSMVIIWFHNGSFLSVHKGHKKENTRSDKLQGNDYIIVILMVQ